MKQKKIYSSIMIFTFSFQAVAQLSTPIFPGYSSCAIANNAVEPSCKAAIDKKYSDDLAAYNKSANLVTGSYDGSKPPTAPTYSCSSSGGVDYACENKYAADKSAYDQQSKTYQVIQQQQANLKAQQDAAAQSRVAANQASTVGSLADVSNQNKQGSTLYKVAQVGFIGGAALYGYWFAQSCSGAGATCQYPLLYKSLALAALGVLAGQQANKHDDAAVQACVAQNQVSSTQTACGSVAPFVPPSISGFPLDPVTGECKPTAPASCKTDRQNIIDQGYDIKAVAKGQSQFAGPNAPFKINPNGTITTKDGKTYKASDFADEKAMIAAGMSAGDARNLANELYGKNGVMAKSGLDAKGALAELNKNSMGTFGAMDGGSMTIKTGADGLDKGDVGTKDLSDRKPSSANEGLVKNFNGDNIGIANDDIFKMMNKRYNLKNSQDSFIGQ